VACGRIEGHHQLGLLDRCLLLGIQNRGHCTGRVPGARDAQAVQPAAER
jgi:hypothetical protein